MDDAHSVSATSDVKAWLCKPKRQGKIISLKRAREPTVGAVGAPFTVSGECSHFSSTKGLQECHAGTHHLVACSNGGAVSMAACMRLHPTNALHFISGGGASLHNKNSVVIGVTSSAGIDCTQLAHSTGDGVLVDNNAPSSWGSRNIERLLMPPKESSLPADELIASRLVFASQKYFETVQKRLIVDLLIKAWQQSSVVDGSTRSLAGTVSVNVESLRQHYPALSLIRACSLWELVLEPMLQFPDWFFQLNGDTIAVSDGATGVPLLNARAFFSVNVESLRQHYPALSLIRACSLWELVLEPMLQFPDWFFQLNGDTIAVSDGATGVPLLNARAFFDVEETGSLISCDARVLDAATLSFEGEYKWRALSCLSPLKKLMSFPLGALRNVITSSMNDTLVDEILEVARFADAIRQPQAITAARRGDTSAEPEMSSSSASIRWEELLRAHVPQLLHYSRSSMSQEQRVEIENVCIYIGASLGIVVADETNSSRSQRKSTHTKASLMELFGGKHPGGLPPFGPYTVRSSPNSVGKGRTATTNSNEDDLLDGLFDNDDVDALRASGNNHQIEVDATGLTSVVDVVISHNVTTNNVSISYKQDESFSQRMQDAQQYPACNDVIGDATSKPCSFCCAATHSYLHNCPWFLARTLHLQRLHLPSKHLRVDFDSKEEDPNQLPGASELALVVAPSRVDVVTEAIAVKSALISKQNRRREQEKQHIWQDFANDIWSCVQFSVQKNSKPKELKAKFMDRVALRKEINDIQSGVDFITKCLKGVVNLSQSEVSAAFRDAIDDWMSELTRVYSS
ncbi:Hypothetical protein, putative [Bodo saltans]|uniref:Uncharacterized protein n=1 Tax=Bodo saltans TaxID=75058 RepID=A0A0S4IPW6_BODSA|nr:Hypothetical protein, putative [Bodo saltans]|eukprot:CUF11058.1 Hypothetical protein, putative [Bodo saltans]